ncbi:MAG: hypothetical protein FWF23_04185 [Alphaproteobacteria bacterium]|nr:hypothetical protein [Alphaproteobacteria bacterium]MCL2504671.1 hypothetical protein [Alphaproteobacteria bacterium]
MAGTSSYTTAEILQKAMQIWRRLEISELEQKILDFFVEKAEKKIVEKIKAVASADIQIEDFKKSPAFWFMIMGMNLAIQAHAEFARTKDDETGKGKGAGTRGVKSYETWNKEKIAEQKAARKQFAKNIDAPKNTR